MTALKPLGSAQREISLRHSLFEEAIALVRNSAVGVLVTAIQVIAGSACRNFSPPGPFLHSGLRPHFKKGLAVVHLGAETAQPNDLAIKYKLYPSTFGTSPNRIRNSGSPYSSTSESISIL